jgi:hypothetical protein
MSLLETARDRVRTQMKSTKCAEADRNDLGKLLEDYLGVYVEIPRGQDWIEIEGIRFSVWRKQGGSYLEYYVYPKLLVTYMREWNFLGLTRKILRKKKVSNVRQLAKLLEKISRK